MEEEFKTEQNQSLSLFDVANGHVALPLRPNAAASAVALLPKALSVRFEAGILSDSEAKIGIFAVRRRAGERGSHK